MFRKIKAILSGRKNRSKITDISVNAYGILYRRVLLKHYEHGGLITIDLNRSADYVTKRLIEGKSKPEGYDDEIIRFGNDIYADILNDRDIKDALIEYLKIMVFFRRNILTDTDGVKIYDNRLSEFGVSERISSIESYLSLCDGLTKLNKSLRKQTKMTRKQIVSNSMLKLLVGLLNGQIFSFRSLVVIFGVIGLTYVFGAFVYVHSLLNEFGLDASNYVTPMDYTNLALSEIYDMIPELIILGLVVLWFIYSDVKTAAIEVEYDKRIQPSSKSINAPIIFIGITAVITLLLSYFVPDFYDPRTRHELVLVSVFILISILIGYIPFERIFTNGLSVRIVLITCVVLIGGLVYRIPGTVNEIKSPPTLEWKYLIGDEILISDEYSLILESSKYVIFYHRGSETTRIVPISDVRDIVTQAPQE